MMRKNGILQTANTSRIEHNVSCSGREQGAGVGGDLLISPPVVPYGPGHHSPLLLPPRTLTMMEPTTGPLITHHRAVLSFISQQLTDRGKEQRLCPGAQKPAVQCPWPLGGASFLAAPEEGQLEGELSGRLQTLPALLHQVLWSFFLLPCLGRDWSPRVRVIKGLLGKGHIPPSDQGLLGCNLPLNILPPLRPRKRTPQSWVQEQSWALKPCILSLPSG